MSYGPDYMPTEQDFEEMFEEAHPRCETCGETLCLGELESCEGGCGHGGEEIAFEYDGLRYCEGLCADEARATLAEDIAAEMLRGAA